MDKYKINCAVGILTFNSAETLKSTLESARDFTEIIICDGGSTDDTLSLARAYGAKVISQDPKFKDENNKIIDFAGARNQMLHLSGHPWFFYLDSDELLTESLVKEISKIVLSDHPASAFWVPRKYTLNGELVRCASTYPTMQMRFFHKDAVTGFIKTIHERIDVRPGAPVLKLQNFMLVPTNPNPAFHRAKWNHYIDLEVARRGRISFFGWLSSALENGKISSFYLLRYFRDLLFCRGKRLPWRLEWERHVYHLNICRRFWKLRRAK